MILATTFASVMTTIGYVLIALLCFMFMVIIHEFGHFIAGKLLGFKIEEFAIGFGPAVCKRTLKSGMVFSLRPFPLGGFCQFEGEDDDNPSPTAFNKQAPWKRLIVLFNGAFFNFLSAIFIITILFSTYGQVLPSIHEVYETAPAENVVNAKAGDVILRVNGKQVNILMQNDFAELLGKQEGDTVEFTVLRDGETVKYRMARGNYSYTDENGETVNAQGFGFRMALGAHKLGFFSALGRSFGFCFFVVYQILATLGKLITGKLGMNAVGGPITTIKTVAEASSFGLSSLVYAVSIISANLAIMNLLPLPALDGSRMVFVLIEWIFRKPVPRKVEAIIHSVGLLLLFGFAIFADVFQFLVS